MIIFPIFTPNSQRNVISHTKMEYQRIGEIIKDRRKSLKITQPTLASLAGIGLNTLVAVERGNGNPKIQTIVAVLDTLGLKLDVTLKD